MKFQLNDVDAGVCSYCEKLHPLTTEFWKIERKRCRKRIRCKTECIQGNTKLDKQRLRDHQAILKIISDFRELSPDEASSLQIFGALLKECKLGYQQGFIKEVLQSVCNEARVSGLLINPNPLTHEECSTDLGNTNRMRPSVTGWPQVQGILRRHLHNAVLHLEEMLDARGWFTVGSRKRLTKSVARLGRL